MNKKAKATAATVACQCAEPCLNCECQATTKPAIKQFPRLNPLIAIGLERFKSDVLAAGFYSREYNQVLPELIDEVLRIIREARS